MTPRDTQGDGRRQAPSLIAFLSFLWPGLGHAALGRTRTALIYGVPVALIALAIVWQGLQSGIESIPLALLSPTTAITVAILLILFGLWRLAAIVDSVLVAGGRRVFRRPSVVATTSVLGAIVIVTHLAATSLAWSSYQASSKIFVAAQGPDSSPVVSPGASASEDPVVDPEPSPAVTPASESDRITVLFTGIDSSEIRNHELTDTLLVVSVDPTDGKVAMVSFPRDIARFRLSDGRLYTGKINSLMSYAKRNKEDFPAGPLATLRTELGNILGVPIHYYAAINLDGFVRMIDAVGGVTINNERAIADPSYGGWTDKRPVGFYLKKGKHKLDGDRALAYVRSRMGAGDNDFTRARRQQQLLTALADKLSDPAMLPRIPRLLEVASDTIRTDFPPERLTEMLTLARTVDDKKIQKIVLGPPYATRPTSGDGIYRLELNPDKVAAVSKRLFGADSAYSEAAEGAETGSP
jgi:LCP family protein required for cell wall assembly